MGKRYNQLDLDDRIELSRHHDAGIAPSEIARIMGRHPTTIGRELKRNSLPKGGYKPASADRIAPSRRRRLSRIERLNPLREHVRDLPRKTELSDYSNRDILDIVWALNTTPRKCIGFLSPAEAFIHQLRCCT